MLYILNFNASKFFTTYSNFLLNIFHNLLMSEESLFPSGRDVIKGNHLQPFSNQINNISFLNFSVHFFSAGLFIYLDLGDSVQLNLRRRLLSLSQRIAKVAKKRKILLVSTEEYT